jgi:hypothetical protein
LIALWLASSMLGIQAGEERGGKLLNVNEENDRMIL